MSNKEKRLLYRIIISGALFAVLLLLHFFGNSLQLPPQVALPIFLAVYLIIGGDVLKKALTNIRGGQVFDENFLMSIATIGAFCLGEYPEGVAVMLFYQVGELFQSRAVGKSRRSIAQLMDIRPDYANVLRDGELTQVGPEEVRVGELIVVKPGERVPLDGQIVEGASVLDTSALTGESAPREVFQGDNILSGCINQSGKLVVSVSKEFGESTVAKILELVENASDKKSQSEQFITRFARYYTPVVVVSAVLLALLPPLLAGQSFSVWLLRSLTFLVISCPCALVISVPLSFFGGIGGASKRGVLVKGSNYLELLARTEIIVFDKTGTLTKGNFAVTDIRAENMSREELLELAACAEHYSTHPIAASIRQSYGGTVESGRVTDVEEIAGHGIKAQVDGRQVLAGNARLLRQHQVEFTEMGFAGAVLYVAVDGVYAGCVCIEDELKPDAEQAIAQLKAAGIRQTVMLTGDTENVGRKVAEQLRLDAAYTELLPGDKVQKLEELLAQKSPRGVLAFVGDGINDAPVLARADVGIAMGGLGSDAAIEAADVVIMTDELSKIAATMGIGKKTLAIAKQNIVFALTVKAIVLLLGALGLATMWAAVFADVGVSVIAILNAMRTLK